MKIKLILLLSLVFFGLVFLADEADAAIVGTGWNDCTVNPSTVAHTCANTNYAFGYTYNDVTMPASISSGDLIIVLLGIESNIQWTTPAGWTKLYDVGNAGPGSINKRMSVYYKIADGTEDSTLVRWNCATSCTNVPKAAFVQAFSGVDTSNPFNVNYQGQSGGNGASLTSVTFPTQTTTVANTLVFAFTYWGDGMGNSFTPSSLNGYTEKIDYRHGGVNDVWWILQKSMPTAGATGAAWGYSHDSGGTYCSDGGCYGNGPIGVIALNPAPTTCSSPCGTIASGATCTAYLSASPACGNACVSEVRTCTNGVLSGSYANASCTAKCCASGACVQTNAGGTCSSTNENSPPCGQACTVTPLNTCQSNGTWTYTPGQYASCSACCNNPWGTGTTTGGSSATAYNATSATDPDTCAAHSETRTCSLSTGLFSPVFSGGYTNQTCTNIGTCPWPASVSTGGVFTIASSCNFGQAANLVAGVEDNNSAATNASNSGALVIGSGVTVTIGSNNNQTLLYGKIVINPGGSIVIAKGVGASMVKGARWVQDTDGDGYPDAANSTVAGGARPNNTYVRKNFALAHIAATDCAPTNPGPCTPAGPSGTAASSTQINLSWTASNTTTGPAATSYDIYYCTGSSCTPTLGPINVATTSYSHTSLSAVTVYGYKIIAKNAAGSATATSNFYATTQAACTNGYTDYDKDGYGTGSYGCYAASGSYNVVQNNTDCNDSGAGAAYVYISLSTTWDADHDGHGMTGAYSANCVGANSGGWLRDTGGTYNWCGSGTCPQVTDCNDASNYVYQNVSDLVLDANHDGIAD